MATYEQYRAMLPVNKHRLDDELEIQAQLMEQITTETVRQNARMLEAKQTLEKTSGRLLAEYKEDDPKLTAQLLDASVKRDADYIKCWQSYIACLSEHGKWQGLQDAWRQKGFSIKTLADLYGMQYFQLADHQTKSRKQIEQEQAQADRRSEMRKAGRSTMPTDLEKAQQERAEEALPVRRRAAI